MILRSACSTLLLLAALAGTAEARERTLPVDRDELVNTGGWTLTTTTAPGGAPVAAPVPFRLVFDRRTVAVKGGCPALQGDYTFAGPRMGFALAATIGADCTGDAAQASAAFLATLNRTSAGALVEPLPYRLRLIADDGTVLEFQSQPMGF
ncbi:MAG: META domain-containing protein [Lysobacteraceae bacterium]